MGLFVAGLWAALAVAAPAAPAAPALPIPPAVIDDTLEITGESIAAQQRQSRLFVDVEVNGAGPFRFLVDSGADRSVVSVALAERLGLPADDPVQLRSIAGSDRIGTVRIDRLKLGNSEIRDIVAPALPARYLGAEGLLGIDALGEQRLMLDFERRRITVQDARRAEPVRPRDPDEIVVSARRRNGQLILTQVRIGRGALYAVIDSGTEITLGNSALFRRVFGRRPPRLLQPITLIGVTGKPVTAQLAVLPDIQIGRMTLQNVTIAFADLAPFALFGLADEPAVLLGNDVLRTFRRVSLDFRHRKVRFLLRR